MSEFFKDPIEVFWPQYVDGVNKSVTAAEQYLEVPAGSISSIEREPDYIATAKTCAVIEPMSNDLIVAGRPSPSAVQESRTPRSGPHLSSPSSGTSTPIRRPRRRSCDQACTSKIILNGVSVARRKRLKPASVATWRNLPSPAWAPSPRATS
jgi:hypothetical protein